MQKIQAGHFFHEGIKWRCTRSCQICLTVQSYSRGQWQAAEIFIDVMFMLDICISFVTCYEDQVCAVQKEDTRNRKRIRQQSRKLIMPILSTLGNIARCCLIFSTVTVGCRRPKARQVAPQCEQAELVLKSSSIRGLHFSLVRTLSKDIGPV